MGARSAVHIQREISPYRLPRTITRGSDQRYLSQPYSCKTKGADSTGAQSGPPKCSPHDLGYSSWTKVSAVRDFSLKCHILPLNNIASREVQAVKLIESNCHIRRNNTY